ncbi:MAG TPA: hypothetical protein VHC20_00620 [Candidatus Paceibacterota bacterium]|nr:hypothetical protein [Candidatus Paceibacterota bacterium]
MEEILALLRQAEQQIAAAQSTLEKMDIEKAASILDKCENCATTLMSLEASLREKKNCFLTKLADAAFAIKGDEYRIKMGSENVRLRAPLSDGRIWFGVGFATCYPASFSGKDSWAKYFWPICEQLVSMIKDFVESDRPDRTATVTSETQRFELCLNELATLKL